MTAVDLSFLRYFSLEPFPFILVKLPWTGGLPWVRSHIPPFGKNQCGLLEELVLKHLAVLTSPGAAPSASQWR